MYDLLVIGGGAAGFYGAIHTARKAPGARVAILEQSGEFLSKVRISGGGRCNLTHRPMEPDVLASHYPRGHRELRGPFHSHDSADTMAFFEALGVPLKVEADGRVFPASNTSESITEALMGEARRLDIECVRSCGVRAFGPAEDASGSWWVEARCGHFQSRNLLLAPGSSKAIWRVLEGLGYPMVPPVPSLFTFRIQDERLEGLQGISSPVELEILPGTHGSGPPLSPVYKRLKKAGRLSAEGPLLITHWGLSGPAVLKLSAWGARYFAERGYHFLVRVNWIPEYHKEGVVDYLEEVRASDPGRTLLRSRVFELPSRLWGMLVKSSEIAGDARWGEVSRKSLRRLAGTLTGSTFEVRGKSTFKEEFVTAGGFPLKQLDFKTFESRRHRGLFLAGEVLDVDAVTGGFNFQNAWTGSFLAAAEIAQRLQP